MRRCLPALLLLASCGPARPDPAVLRYALVTTLPPDSPLSRDVDRLVAYRRAEVFRLPTFAPARTAELLAWLRERDFAYVAFVAPPADLDAAALSTLAALACEVDSDPYPDFAFGIFPAFDAALLRRQVDALIGAEAKVEKRLLRVTRLACAAPASADRTDRLDWATGLPVRRLEARDGDASFLDRSLPDLERCDHLVLAGEPAPGGLRGLPPAFLRRLRLDSSAVFCGPGWTGDPARPFLAELVRAGATSVFAPPADSAPSRADAEWAEAVFSDLPAGEVAKRCRDTALLAGDGELRLLFGDPLLDSWTRPVRAPVAEVSSRLDPEGRWIDLRYKIVSWDAPAWFADPRGGERIHLRVSVPTGVKRTPVLAAKAGDDPLDARAGAVERWRGATLAHVLVRAPRLSREDLFLTLRLGLE